MSPNPDSKKPRSMLTLWILLAVCVLPLAASYGLYYLAPPSERMNYGELLQPKPLPEMQLMDLDGQPVQLGSLKGKWVLLHADSGACDERCVTKLYKLRQVRLTQGKNMERVVRVWLITDQQPANAMALRNYEGTLALRASADALRNFPVSADIRDHIWLIDPLGNLVLRYPPAADPSGIKTDLQRLLKLSRIG
jgi:hypothetical protein